MTKNKVLYFSDKDISASFRYRCKNICDALGSSKSWQAEYILAKDFERAKKELKTANLLIISRQADRLGLARRLIHLAKKQGITTVLDLDDYVFDHREAKFIYSATGEKTPLYWASYAFHIGLFARRVDKFCVSNAFLGEKLSDKFRKPFIVISNFPSAEQFSLAKTALSHKKPNEGFLIGYFSGTRTHKKDFELIEKEICRFLDAHDDAKLKIVGEFDLPPSLKKYAQSGQIIINEKVSFDKLPEHIARVDANLAPLVLNDFTNSKSALKFFESALVKVPTLASPSFSFSLIIKDGINGFLCKKGDWYKNLEFLYKYPAARAKIANNAYEFCLENFSKENTQKIIERALDELAK